MVMRHSRLLTPYFSRCSGCTTVDVTRENSAGNGMAQNEARPLMKLLLQPCRRWELAHVVRVESKRYVRERESMCLCERIKCVNVYTNCEQPLALGPNFQSKRGVSVRVPQNCQRFNLGLNQIACSRTSSGVISLYCPPRHHSRAHVRYFASFPDSCCGPRVSK